jgi:thiol-disulfide isomerase/thioredoxin
MKKFYLLGVATLILASIVVPMLVQRSGSNVPPRQPGLAPCFETDGVGDKATSLPTIILPCLGEGGADTLHMDSLAAGKPTLVALWASYCWPCRKELPAFNEFSLNNPSRVRVVTVLTSDRPESAEMVAEIAPSLPVAYDDTGSVMRAFGLRRAVPALLIFGRDGSLIDTYQGVPLVRADDIASLLTSNGL